MHGAKVKIVSYIIKIAELFRFKVAYGIQTTSRWLRAKLTSALHYIEVK